jgi:SnoaL-like polyketide cyclase
MTRWLDPATLSWTLIGAMLVSTLELSHATPRIAMLSSGNETLVRRAIAAIWNRGDLDVADELFAPEYVNHHGLISDLVRGPEAIKISAAFHRLAFPGLRVVIEDLNTDGDTVVLSWTATSESPGRAAGRNTLGTSERSLKGITRSRFADGKIAESWTEWNQIGVLRDLGFVPTE